MKTYAYFNENSKIPNIKVIRDYLESVKCDNFDEVFLYIENKDYNTLKELLAKETPDDENSLFYARDGEGRTPLIFAALLGDLKAVQILLEPFEGIEVYNYIGITSEPFKWNAIFYAIFGGNAEVVAILLGRSQLDYLPYRDIFNWSSFDYLMLNEKLFLELFEMSNECNILQNWISLSYIDCKTQITVKDLEDNAHIIVQRDSIPLVGITSSVSELILYDAYVMNIIRQGTPISQPHFRPQGTIVLNGVSTNIFYYYYYPTFIAYQEGNYETLKKLFSKFSAEQAILENRVGKTLFWEMFESDFSSGTDDFPELSREILLTILSDFQISNKIKEQYFRNPSVENQNKLIRLLNANNFNEAIGILAQGIQNRNQHAEDMGELFS